MMRYIYIILMMPTLLALTSCYTSSKFTVETLPGTEILTSEYKLLAVANNEGKATIKISDDFFYSFLLSHQPNTNNYVPFALDYKYKSYIGTRLQYWGGIFLSSLGIVPMLAGTVAAIQGDDDLVGPFFGAGIALETVGLGMGIPANMRSEQENQDNQYKYLSQQRTNHDIPISKPILTAQQETKSKAIPLKKEESSEEKSTVSTKRVSQQSTKTLKDYGAQIEGIYIGNGKLTSNSQTIETYKDIRVILSRESKETVIVNVVESNGEPFFQSGSTYSIIKNNNNSFVLTLDGISSAKIRISNDKTITYTHPRVNIDGDIYTLSITGKLNN